VPSLVEVRDITITDYKKEKGVQIAETKAKALAQALRAGENLAVIAKNYGLSVVKPKPFASRDSIDDTLRMNNDIMKAVFSSKVGESSESIKADSVHAVFRLLALDAFDEVQYAKERGSLRQSLQDKRKDMLYLAYMDKKEKELRDQNKVEINQALIDQIVG
jgi:hypothetical protein